jgi:hypothetical protein
MFGVEFRNSVLRQVFLLGVFPNMALLFVFYTLETWRLAKGVMLGAIPYLIASIVFMA